MYPFVKTDDWYLMSRDARQGMMNEHIRIGKQYREISQLLLYSIRTARSGVRGGVRDGRSGAVLDLVNDLR